MLLVVPEVVLHQIMYLNPLSRSENNISNHFHPLLFLKVVYVWVCMSTKILYPDNVVRINLEEMILSLYLSRWFTSLVEENKNQTWLSNFNLHKWHELHPHNFVPHAMCTISPEGEGHFFVSSFRSHIDLKLNAG